MRVGDRIGRLIGAGAGQVVVGDTTTLQLFRALAAACGMQPGRKVILVEAGNFPADNYIAHGLADLLGQGFEVRELAADQIAGAIDETVAVVSASEVNYRTGRRLELAPLTRLAHEHGALTVWDLAHSAGVVDPRLDEIGADFAVGCTYKYLNGGPGAPAFLYVNRNLHGRARSPTWGWLGHAEPFAMRLEHAPAEGIRAFLCGTPRMIALDALEHALRSFDGIELGQLRTKSRALGERFVACLAPTLAARSELRLLSPRASKLRGAHVSLGHPRAGAVVRALAARGIQVDYRAPDTMRFGFSPLYVRHVDVTSAAVSLVELLDAETWREPHFDIDDHGP